MKFNFLSLVFILRSPFITLLLVLMLYSIFLLDLKLIRWDVKASSPTATESEVCSTEPSHA